MGNYFLDIQHMERRIHIAQMIVVRRKDGGSGSFLTFRLDLDPYYHGRRSQFPLAESVVKSFSELDPGSKLKRICDTVYTLYYAYTIYLCR